MLYFYNYFNYLYSFLCGVLISIIYFLAQITSVKALLSRNILIKFSSFILWLRYIVLAIIFVLIIKSSFLNLYVTLVPIAVFYIFYSIYFYVSLNTKTNNN